MNELLSCWKFPCNSLPTVIVVDVDDVDVVQSVTPLEKIPSKSRQIISSLCP